MKVSLKWLGRHVDLDDKSPREVLDDLTMSTCEVEGIVEYGAGLDDVVVGHVVERKKHPDADKLSLVQVDTGDGALHPIVCGAPNVAAGQKVAVVRPGARLPGGITIKKTRIRGVESLGMVCSEKELGLSEAGEGILVLDPSLPPGARFADVALVRDAVLEIDNKSINHRPDLWGHHGIARELAAIWGRPLRPACEPAALPSKGRTLGIEIADREACPRYTGLVLEGVRAVPSPAWLKWLLQAVGQRSHDALVDATNFVMLDLGQPMHAFDLRQLDRHGVGVRRARDGETLETLDGVLRRLTRDDLLITSGDEPVALAGIMGGARSAVAADTTELFLESANFRASVVRRTSTRLGLRTDASARFEKALDPAFAELAVHRFVGLIGELCPGARAAGPLVDPARWHFTPRTIRLRRSRLDLKLGVEVGDERSTDILRRLAFDVAPAEDGFDVGVPSFRATKDVAIEDDLIEEVGRMFRYDNIPERPLVGTVAVPPREPEPYLARRLVRLAASELACHEVYNYSFVSDAVLAACRAGDQRYVRVTNPVAPEIARLRRHVMPSLLASLQRNLEVTQDAELRLVEVGRGYQPEQRDAHGLPFEVHEFAILWSRRSGADPYPELRSRVESLLRRIGHPLEGTLRHPAPPSWLHPGRAVQLEREARAIGSIGALHPEVAERMKLPATTALTTLDLRAILRCERHEARYEALPTFPSQPVDVALLVPRQATVADIARFLAELDPKLVRAVELFEVWAGEGIPAGRKSLNFTVTLGASDRTLTGKDEEKYLARVRERCAEVGAELRG